MKPRVITFYLYLRTRAFHTEPPFITFYSYLLTRALNTKPPFITFYSYLQTRALNTETSFYNFPFIFKARATQFDCCVQVKSFFLFLFSAALVKPINKFKSLLFTVGTILLAAFVTAFGKIKIPDAGYSVIAPVKQKQFA